MRNVMLCLFVLVGVADGATFSTRNFAATATTAADARAVAEAAENQRERLAVYWLGKTLPHWSRPCSIQVTVGSMGASGSTNFAFVGRTVHIVGMNVRGTEQRILDSVIPHEVNHTIFASHFRQPVPRWADEGAATLCEHRAEKQLYWDRLRRVVSGGRYIPLSSLTAARDYPTGAGATLDFYAEGYGLTEYLVQQSGPEQFVQLLQTAQQGGWDSVFRQHYGTGLIDVERDFRRWVVSRATPSDVDRPTVPTCDRPTLYVVGATWCGRCRAFDQAFSTDDRFRAALERRFCIKHVDGPSHRHWCDERNVTGYPAFVVEWRGQSDTVQGFTDRRRLYADLVALVSSAGSGDRQAEPVPAPARVPEPPDAGAEIDQRLAEMEQRATAAEQRARELAGQLEQLQQSKQAAELDAPEQTAQPPPPASSSESTNAGDESAAARSRGVSWAGRLARLTLAIAAPEIAIPGSLALSVAGFLLGRWRERKRRRRDLSAGPPPVETVVRLPDEPRRTTENHYIVQDTDTTGEAYKEALRRMAATYKSDRPGIVDVVKQIEHLAGELIRGRRVATRPQNEPRPGIWDD